MCSISTLSFLRGTDESKQLCTRGVLKGQERGDNEFSLISICVFCASVETHESKQLLTAQGTEGQEREDDGFRNFCFRRLFFNRQFWVQAGHLLFPMQGFEG